MCVGAHVRCSPTQTPLQVRVTALAKCDDGAETAVSVYLYCDERGQLSGDWCYEAWRSVHLDSFAASCREWASVRCVPLRLTTVLTG